MHRPEPAVRPDPPPEAGGAMAWLRDRLEPYQVDDALAARFRARQLQAVQRLTRVAMVANVVNALAVMLALNPRLARTDLVAWAGVVVLIGKFVDVVELEPVTGVHVPPFKPAFKALVFTCNV